MLSNSKKEDLITLQKEIKAELYRLLNFWNTEVIDDVNGGYIGRIDHYGNKDIEAVKGVVLNTRILWTFASAYRVLGDLKYKKAADRAYAYLIDNFWDCEHGGLIWSVDYKGAALNKRKQAYAQGFGIYALSEYTRATGNHDALIYAQELFHLLESKFIDVTEGGYIEALANDWSALDDFRLSEKDDNLPKSMNTHLHILEPYTNLYRIWPNVQLKESILKLIEIFQTRIISPGTGHFNLFFDMDWSVRSTAISYGHDIEGAWLMHEAAHEINDATVIANTQKTALKLVDITLSEGIDMDGSLFNERDGAHLDTDKHWWPQAEAMVGVVDAYEIKQDDKYLIELQKLWCFIKYNLIDKEKGEWYWLVDINSIPNEKEDKVGFWKCSYHNSRALMEVMERIDKLVSNQYGVI